MCKTVQATPQAGHSVVLDSSSSFQGASGLNGSASREMEVNGSAVGRKVVDSNELERLFTQPNTQAACKVSPDREGASSEEKLVCFSQFINVTCFLQLELYFLKLQPPQAICSKNDHSDVACMFFITDRNDN